MKQYDVRQHPEYDEMFGKLVRSLGPERVLKHYTAEEVLNCYKAEQRVAGLTPEERVAGLSPEERVVGLAPEKTLLAMPDEALRCLSYEYVRSLPRSLQTAIRRRLSTRH